MKILRNTMPISDIYNLMKSGELTINRKYQRGSGLWPPNARSYFVDTVINEFPFPKVVLRQIVDLKTKKSKREIIDGQQRLTTLRDFIDNKFKLSKVSKKYAGLTFEQLPDDVSGAMLTYEVSIDNIVSASTEEILEIFRRINSYTLPLNTSEKRHATYQGEFKWFISNLTEYTSPFFEQYKILSIRDISRMMDADLLTECSQLIFEGVQNRSASKLEKLYKENDLHFPRQAEFEDKINGSFNFIKDNLIEVFENCKIQSYMFYSLIGALIYNKYGFVDSKNDMDDIPISNQYVTNIDLTNETLIRLFAEVEEKNEDGEFQDFVKASIATTHSYKNRLTRIKTLINIFQA